MLLHLCHFDTTQTLNIHPQCPSSLRRRPPCGGKQSLWRILFHQIHQFCFPSAFSSFLPCSLEITKAGKIYISCGTVLSSYHSSTVRKRKRRKKKDYILSSIWGLWVTDTKVTCFESTSEHMGKHIKTQRNISPNVVQSLTKLSEQFHIEKCCWFVKVLRFPDMHCS